MLCHYDQAAMFCGLRTRSADDSNVLGTLAARHSYTIIFLMMSRSRVLVFAIGPLEYESFSGCSLVVSDDAFSAATDPDDRADPETVP